MAASEAYLGLARKYRPQTFEDLIGQEAVADSLAKALRQNRLVHGHLMAGPRGTGKTTTARILARALNCVEGPTATPCGVCRHCIDIAAGNDMDVIEIDAASNTGVDNIRELRERINLAPFSARYKVYIIDEVHMLSTGAFNALLKTLEEPPPGVVFVFATTEIEKVPETIRSRCASHQFRRITADDIVRRLMQVADGEKISLAPEAAREIFGHIARSVDGGMRDAMMVFDQLLALTDGKPDAATAIKLLGLADPGALARAVDWLAQGKADELLKLVEDLVERGRSLERFVKELIAYLRDLMLLQAGVGENLVALTGEPLDQARRQARELDPAPLYNIVNQMLELEERLKQSTQARFLLEFTFLRLARVKPVVPLDQIMSRIQALPEASMGGASVAVPAPSAPPAASRVAEPAAKPAPARRTFAASKPSPAFAVMHESAPPAESPAGAPPQASTGKNALSGLPPAEIFELLERQLSEGAQFLAGDRYLKAAAGLVAEGSTLRVLWRSDQSYQRKIVEKSENIQQIEAALQQIAGQPIKLVSGDAPANTQPAAPAPAVPRANPQSVFADSDSSNPDPQYDEDSDPQPAPQSSLPFSKPVPADPADRRSALERAQAFIAGDEEHQRRFRMLRDMFKAEPIDENGQPLPI